MYLPTRTIRIPEPSSTSSKIVTEKDSLLIALAREKIQPLNVVSEPQKPIPIASISRALRGLKPDEIPINKHPNRLATGSS